MTYTPFLRSAHLKDLVERVCPPTSLKMLEACFALAMRHYGEHELDYRREPGVSFNPRPARVALIVVNDAGETAPTVLAAAFLATVLEYFQERGSSAPSFECAEAPTLILLGSIERYLQGHLELRAVPVEAQVVIAGLVLDRLRHAHLTDAIQSPMWRQLRYRDAQSVSTALSLRYQKLARLLVAWEERTRRKYGD